MSNIYKLTWTRIWLILLLVSIYIFPLYIRYGILPGSYAVWNILGALSSVGLSWKYLKKKKSYNKVRFGLWIIMALLAFFTQVLKKVFISDNILLLTNFFIPILPLAFEYKLDVNDAELIRKSTNVVCVLQIIAYLFKLLTGFSFSKVLGSAIGSTELIELTERPIAEFRFCSWMGHELTVCAIFLISFALNVVYYRNIEKTVPPYRYAILSAVGVAITASKSGLLVFMVLFVLVYCKKIKYAIGAIVIFGVVLYSGVFDFVLSRFSEGSLSTYRIEVFQYIMQNDIVSFSLFTGRGSQALVNLSIYGNNLTAGFEFILLIYALEFGVVFAFLTTIYLMVIQIVDIWKLSKEKITVIAAVCVMVYFNCYNALGIYHDEMFIFVMTIIAIRSYCLKSSEEKSGGICSGEIGNNTTSFCNYTSI